MMDTAANDRDDTDLPSRREQRIEPIGEGQSNAFEYGDDEICAFGLTCHTEEHATSIGVVMRRALPVEVR